jgi:hypothetical protein
METSDLLLANGLRDLNLLLNDGDWAAADRLTADLLLQGVMQCAPEGNALWDSFPSRQRPWLTTEALATVPCHCLQAIDDCWQGASAGHFGFSAQLQIYTEVIETIAFDPTLRNWSSPHPFFDEVGWLMLPSLRPLGFLRFYSGLEFDLDAPRGHLPALWYWQVSGWQSWRVGGFGTGQGGGYGDLARLDALLLRLSRCGQLGL